MSAAAPVDPLFLGLDFGTESVRAILVTRRGETVASAVSRYEHGQITPGSPVALRLFPDGGLPPHFALQHPRDWVDAAAAAVRETLQRSGAAAERVVGIGVDFTSCTMLPCRSDGTPLCLRAVDGERSDLAADPHAWPKLWKHHGALEQTERLNALARRRGETWLERYGGIIGLEWLLPKMLEVIDCSPACAETAEVWLEAGDWFVWQCVGAPALETDRARQVAAEALPRSTCQAGYKALWSAEDGYTSPAFLEAVGGGLQRAVKEKLPGRMVSPGALAGRLCPAMARRLGLREGIAVSGAIIDAHAGVPGAGVGEAGTLVMVMGTSGCHMLLSERGVNVPGVAGVVRDGILPGFYGYETGQAAMGDAFDFVRRMTGAADFVALDDAAARISPGADGVVCLDWFNGCRTPLMDGSLRGAFAGLALHHGPAHLYRAALEGSAFGLRWVVDTLREGGRDGGVPVERFVATGGLPNHNPLFVEIVAAVLGAPVEVHGAQHGPALGAAILGALAAGKEAGGFEDVHEAVEAMAGAKSALPRPRTVQAKHEASRLYEHAYRAYRNLAEENAASDSAMRLLHRI